MCVCVCVCVVCKNRHTVCIHTSPFVWVHVILLKLVLVIFYRSGGLHSCTDGLGHSCLVVVLLAMFLDSDLPPMVAMEIVQRARGPAAIQTIKALHNYDHLHMDVTHTHTHTHMWHRKFRELCGIGSSTMPLNTSVLRHKLCICHKSSITWSLPCESETELHLGLVVVLFISELFFFFTNHKATGVPLECCMPPLQHTHARLV